MAKTFAQLTQDIETLKAKAETVRKKEVAGVVDRIKKAIAVYDLTAEDLGLTGEVAKVAKAARKAPAKQKAATNSPAPIKYRDGAGNAWGGRGPRPMWLKAALATGRSLDSFAADSAGTGAAPVTSESGVADVPKPAKKPAQKSKKASPVAKSKQQAPIANVSAPALPGPGVEG